MGKAWLLSKSGKLIDVEFHPSINYQFNDVVELVCQYGDAEEQALVNKFKLTPTEAIKDDILNIYLNNWCKIRVWGTFSEEVTFRINSVKFDWYSIIVEFLIKHPQFKNSLITVESDKINGIIKTFWDRISYNDAVDTTNATILAAKIKNALQN